MKKRQERLLFFLEYFFPKCQPCSLTFNQPIQRIKKMKTNFEDILGINIFNEQDILNLENEPNCICSSENLFWLSFDGLIIGYTTSTSNKKYQKLYEFQTVWEEIFGLEYFPKLNKIVTIEKRDLQQVCRVK
jgi:hypothetical protein